VLRSESKATGIRAGASKAAHSAFLRDKFVTGSAAKRGGTRDRLEQSFLGKREDGGIGGGGRAKSSRDQLKDSFLSPGQAFQKATSGQARDLPFRAEMEKTFGMSFKHVKAYFGDKDSAEGLAHLNARGAAQGNVVVFSSANPTKETVAHELAHVVQNQRGGHTASHATSEMGREGDANEREADKVAKQAANGHAVEIEQRGGDGLHLDAVDLAFNAEKQATELLHLTAGISGQKERMIALATRLSKMYSLNALEKSAVLQLLGQKLGSPLSMSDRPQSYDLHHGDDCFRVLKGLAQILYGTGDRNKKGKYQWRELL
jgi:hypothetical protein